jgi:hypothetical protein
MGRYFRSNDREGLIMRKANATSLRSLLAVFSRIFAAASKLAAIRRNHFARATPGLKALLAAAPLEGIELDRARDFGREIDFCGFTSAPAERAPARPPPD